MTDKNYYEILEVPETASATEIKQAYYRLAKRYHPDINPKTANLFKHINEAYETLGDAEKRAAYDRSLHETYDSDDIDDDFEPEYSSGHDYYANAEYYQDPANEPIINILEEFFKYRIENAFSAIWNRNIFVIFGNAFMCMIGWMAVLYYRIYKCIARDAKKPRYRKSPWYNWVIDTVMENKLFKIMSWWLFLTGMFCTKAICLMLKYIYWLFKNVIRHFLIPLAIMFLAHANNNRRNN